MSINIEAFKKTMSFFPTGVCVITCKDEAGNNLGITINSFNSVSLNPPLILWSINKNTHSAEVFTHTKHFVVNILASDQATISNQFASPIKDRFQGINYHTGIADTPILNGVTAYLQCKKWQAYEGGDHDIIIGEVIDSFTDDSKKALVYYKGNYTATN